MAKQKEKSEFRRYYDLIYSHGVITTSNKEVGGIFKRIIGIDIGVLFVFISLCVFRDSRLVHTITDGNKCYYYLYLTSIGYAAIVLSSMTIYNIISYRYEKKHKHELNRKDIKGLFKIISGIYNIINLIWITFVCTIKKIFELLKIEKLIDSMTAVAVGSSYSIVAGWMILRGLLGIADYIDHKYGIPQNEYINYDTYVYWFVLIAVWISKYIPYWILKKCNKLFYKNNRLEEKRVIKQYKRYTYYLYALITLFLKPLAFDGSEKVIVDALFYAATILSLISSAKSD